MGLNFGLVDGGDQELEMNSSLIVGEDGSVWVEFGPLNWFNGSLEIDPDLGILVEGEDNNEDGGGASSNNLGIILGGVGGGILVLCCLVVILGMIVGGIVIGVRRWMMNRSDGGVVHFDEEDMNHAMPTGDPMT